MRKRQSRRIKEEEIAEGDGRRRRQGLGKIGGEKERKEKKGGGKDGRR